MRTIGSATPFTSFNIGPAAPQAVLDAKAHFDAVASQYVQAKQQLKDAKQAAKDARAADIVAASDAYAAGNDPGPGTEQAATVLVADLEAKVEALNLATDQLGNDLANAIVAARPAWTAALRKAEADAAKSFDKAMQDTRKALDDLRPARAAAQWLEDFDAGQAAGGKVGQFAGGRLSVRGSLHGQVQDPSELLALAAQVTQPATLAPSDRSRLTPEEVAAAKAKREPVIRV